MQGGGETCRYLPAMSDSPGRAAHQSHPGERLATETTLTALARAILPGVAAHPGLSGVLALPDGRHAFAARALLANAAQRALDVQYYIWHNDTTGTVRFDALRRAADRGVQVRLLLDDNNTAGLDPVLAALDTHANIAVKLFNPFFHRRWRVLDYLGDFARVNRRMHNKSFTADGQVTIVGGRNVGDEYFGAGHDLLFVDLDVLAVGPVVREVSTDFERYWTSASAYPVPKLLPRASAESLAEVVRTAAQVETSPEALAYREALGCCRFVNDLLEGELAFDWAPTAMVSDNPAKALGHARDEELLWSKLKARIGTPTRQLEMISPYFVPEAGSVEHFAALARSGVTISVLTNSLEATDVAPVHAGYARHRKPLLQAGVTIFEMKRAPAADGVARQRIGSSGSSRSSLHAKTFAVDQARVFVGSFNFDPRSARLNTELGFVIESPALANSIATAFGERIPERAYKVGLGGAGRLEWSELMAGKQVVHAREPGAGFWLRLALWVLRRLPLEWLL